MKMFRWHDYGSDGDMEIIIYARSVAEAIEYLKKFPLYWHLNLVAERFQEVVAPKGPSPSVLVWKLGNVISAD